MSFNQTYTKASHGEKLSNNTDSETAKDYRTAGVDCWLFLLAVAQTSVSMTWDDPVLRQDRLNELPLWLPTL